MGAEGGVCQWSIPPAGDREGRNNYCTRAMQGTPAVTNTYTTLETSQRYPCNYAVAGPATGCRVRFSELSTIEVDLQSSGCAVSTGYSAGPWASLYAFEDSQWSPDREIDFMETNFGGSPGAYSTDNINTNWSGSLAEAQKTWYEQGGDGKVPFQQSKAWGQHVSARFEDAGGGAVRVAVRHCDYPVAPFSGNLPPASCFKDQEAIDCSRADTACKVFPAFSPDAYAKFVLDIWNGGPTHSCDLTSSPIYYTTQANGSS